MEKIERPSRGRIWKLTVLIPGDSIEDIAICEGKRLGERETIWVS